MTPGNSEERDRFEELEALASELVADGSVPCRRGMEWLGAEVLALLNEHNGYRSAERSWMATARSFESELRDLRDGAFCGLCGERYRGELPRCEHSEREMIPGSGLPLALSRSFELFADLTDDGAGSTTTARAVSRDVP